MLTYDLKKWNLPLYDALYREIREDILSGRISHGEKLPSKRALAEHLRISKVTVENAYAQLLAEGYISSRCRCGYFAEGGDIVADHRSEPAFPKESPRPPTRDLTHGGTEDGFPFSVWARLMRGVIAEVGERLLLPTETAGIYPLRAAIAGYLYRMRGIRVLPEQIVVGAGAEYLYQLILQLLGKERIYAAEEPGHKKFHQVCSAAGVRCMPVTVDDEGLSTKALEESGASVAHLSPAHHFPTGAVASPQRRRELLGWAMAEDRYLVEDDYDSEFRLSGRPIPPLFSQDTAGRVIYINTFSKTMAPSFRIGYMVLPSALLECYREKLGFYSSTVPAFEQYTLARFLEEGYFEKHLSRMKKRYKEKREGVLSLLSSLSLAKKVTPIAADAGLHFLLTVETKRTDDEIKAAFHSCGYVVQCLSDYYTEPKATRIRTLVLSDVGYAAEDFCNALIAGIKEL